MEKIPDAVKEFLECRIKACTESDIFFQSSNKLKYMKEVVKESVLGEIVPYYHGYGYNASLKLYDLLTEPLKSTNSHNNFHLRNVEFSLILSPRALVAGYFDVNSHFRKDGVQRKLETKTFPVNFIHVDDKIGKLYVGVSIENIAFFSER
jgi:hypothetical protein